ncbi:MAG: MFS transporter [Hyphomicrobiales bacterium]|nr:MFS transporter [Hyphomicrobiales bacterium]
MTMLVSRLGRDARVLGLVGTGHFLSHFYNLTLPPLLPLLKTEFDASYTALGLAMTCFYAASGIVQVPIGFLVDRIGGRLVLVAGLMVEAGAIGLISLAQSVEALVALAFLAGLGHSVFHPADYKIISASVEEKRMARAFSIHTFCGHLGSAMAPAVIIFLVALADWRAALVMAGAVGIITAIVILLQGDVLRDDAAVAERPEKTEAPSSAAVRTGSTAEGIRFLMSVPMLTFFLFYVMTSVTSSGMNTFSVTAVVSLFDAPLAAANTGLTGFLFASAIGVLMGGFILDRTSRHNLVAALAFLLTAVAVMIIGSVALPSVLLIVLFTLAGFSQGVVRPARDMLLRAAAPPGMIAKSFGFVSTGMAVGGMLAPVLFGWLIDLGAPQAVFWALAGIMLVAVLIVLVPLSRKR